MSGAMQHHSYRDREEEAGAHQSKDAIIYVTVSNMVCTEQNEI